MKKFHKLLCAAVIAAAIFVLASCSPDQPSASATPAPTQSSGPSSETNLKNALQAGEEYRYYAWNTLNEEDPFENAGSRADILKERKSAFEAKYGVTIRYVKSTGVDDWYAEPFASAQSGKPIADLFNVGGSYVTLLAYTYGGGTGSILRSLDEFSEYSDFSDPEYWDQSAQKICTFNGKLYFCVPSPIGYELVANNKVTLFNYDLVSRGGLSAEELYNMSNQGEWTWEAFRDAAIKCTFPEDNIYGTAIGDNVGIMSALITSNGGSYFEKQEYEGNLIDRYTGNSANALEAWDFYVKMAKDDGIIELSGAAETTTFSAGKIAFLITGLSRTTTIYQRMKSDYGVLFPPKGPKAEDYISDQDSFVPYCIFNGASNAAGCAQILSEYFRPIYGRSSEENQAMLESELITYLRDSQSMATCKKLPEISKVQSHMLYIKLRTATEEQAMMESVLYGHAWQFARGEESPAQYFDSVASLIDNTVYSVTNPNK